MLYDTTVYLDTEDYNPLLKALFMEAFTHEEGAATNRPFVLAMN